MEAAEASPELRKAGQIVVRRIVLKAEERKVVLCYSVVYES